MIVFLVLFSCAIDAQEDFRVWPYLQHPTADAMSILWFSENGESGEVNWWIEDPGQGQDSGPEFSLESDPEPAEALAYSSWEDSTFFGDTAASFPYRHRVRLENLEPGTMYGYRVNQGGDSFSSSFRTAVAGNDSIRFIVYGDSETEPESTGIPTSWPDPVTGESRLYLVDQTTGYRNNLEVIRSRQPDLVLIAGDLTQHGGEQRDWDEFWHHNTDSVSDLSLAGQVPLVTAPGNHEYYEGTFLGQYSQPGSERAIQRYLTYFEAPLNHADNEEQEGRYYSFRYGPGSFIVLDVCNNNLNESEDDTNWLLFGESDPEGGNAPDFGIGSTQYNWLEEQLIESQVNALFTFVMFHHSPYSSGPHGLPLGFGNLEDYQSGIPLRILTPLFMKYGVDAVFNGHDEMLERSEVSGTELFPDGTSESHIIPFYDVGIGGDGLRGIAEGTDNTYQKFLVHSDVPEVWEAGILKSGGKHYGHLEVDIVPKGDDIWEAILTPVYVLPLFNESDSAYSGFERKVYDDRIILTAVYKNPTLNNKGIHGSLSGSRSFPNPFSALTNIEYNLAESAYVFVSISDAQGRLIRTLEEGMVSFGVHSLVWDGKDDFGGRVSPGLYFYRIEISPGEQLSGRIIYLDY